MTKKTILFFILTFIVLVLTFSLKADEKDERWINQTIRQAAPHTQLPGGGFYGGLVPPEDEEMSCIAIQNINAHLMEVARLRYQGWSDRAIAAHFEQTLTHTQAGPGAISGKLTEKGGAAIKYYASVTAYNEFGRYSGSDYYPYFNNGRYNISNLPPGKYYLLVRSYSYEDQYYRNATDWRKAKKVRVTQYKETRNINFKLKLIYQAKGDGTISGQVKGQDGTPLMNCIISVYNLDYRSINSSTSDANGHYVVPDIPTGEYKVSCYFEESGASMNIWYRNSFTFEDASVVSVEDPKTTPNIDFVLEIGGIIEGKVFSPSGKPVEPYTCGVVAYDMQQNIIRVESTDDKGRFTMGFLPKGRYKLNVRYWGAENAMSGWYKNAKKFKSATPIAVNPPQTKNVTITLKPGGIIKGKVTGSNGQPIVLGCEIRAYDDDGWYIKSTRADENGQFVILGLETGRYKLYADIYAYPYEGSPQPASEWYNGKHSYRDAEFVKVTAPATKSNINFTLSLGGYITCRVVDFYGYPLDYEATVYAYNSRAELVSYADFANYDGRFAINGLPSGNYRVRAVYYGDEDYLNEFYDNKLYFEVAKDIAVTAPGGTGDIFFELDYAGILQGFLTDEKKNRVIDEENHLVPIYAFDAETGEFAGQTSNTFMSGYHLELLEGNYKLAALSFYYNWMASADDFGVTYHPNGKKFNDPATKIYSATPGIAKKLASLALGNPKGSISGTIYDKSSGLAVNQGLYIVFVFDEDGYLVSLSSYADCNKPISGEYRVGGLRPGHYYLIAAAIDELSNLYNIAAEWYGGVEIPMGEFYNYTPKMEIPAGAAPVTVGTAATAGIDFYLDIEK
jgi:hypothetical protein